MYVNTFSQIILKCNIFFFLVNFNVRPSRRKNLKSTYSLEFL